MPKSDTQFKPGNKGGPGRPPMDTPEHEARLILSKNSPAAATKIVDFMNGPYLKESLSAATQILDRAGIVAPTKIEVEGTLEVFVNVRPKKAS